MSHTIPCPRVRVGEPFDAARDCGTCWHWHHSPEHRRIMGGDPKDVVPVRRSLPIARPPCRHEGPVVEPCKTCPATAEERHVRLCFHPSGSRDKCTRAHPLSTLQRCDQCSEREDPEPPPAVTLPPATPVGRRHLVYHLLPVSGNGVWQEGVNQLRLRWPLFTGRKIIAVATGGPVRMQTGNGHGQALPLDPPDVVRRYLPPDAEVIEVANDPGQWELVSWGHLWKSILAGAADADAVLYAHAKGVTRSTAISAARYEGTPQHWARTLYTLSLDHWPEVEKEFARGCPMVGAMKKHGPFFNGHATPGMSDSQWHYSGNFWWVRAGAMKAFLRTPVPECAWGTEAWPGIVCPLEEAGNVGPEVPNSDSYDVGWWNTVMVPAMARWTADHPVTPLTPTFALKQKPAGSVRLSVIVATQGRPSLARTLASITPQLLHGDELLVERDDSGDWGAAARTRAIAKASGDHLIFLDDDDVWTPDALQTVRSALAANPGRPHLFQMRYSGGRVLWDRQEIADGVVSTVQFVCPNDPFKFGVWTTRYQGDYDFIRTTCDHYPAGPVWVPKVICEVRPDHPNG